jgi:metal-responsive CopG/Arc/MetJ family transcriptional regulator
MSDESALVHRKEGVVRTKSPEVLVRTTVALTERQIEALEQIGRRNGVPNRSATLREAIEVYLAQRKQSEVQAVA